MPEELMLHLAVLPKRRLANSAAEVGEHRVLLEKVGVGQEEGRLALDAHLTNL